MKSIIVLLKILSRRRTFHIWAIVSIYASIFLCQKDLWDISCAHFVHSRFSVAMEMITFGIPISILRISPYLILCTLFYPIRKYLKKTKWNIISSSIYFSFSFALSAFFWTLINSKCVTSILYLPMYLALIAASLLAYQRVEMKKQKFSTVTPQQCAKKVFFISDILYTIVFFVTEFVLFDSAVTRSNYWQSIILFFGYLIYAIIWSTPYYAISIISYIILKYGMTLWNVKKEFVSKILIAFFALAPAFVVYFFNYFMFAESAVYNINENSLKNESIMLTIYCIIYLPSILLYFFHNRVLKK